jgi:putative Mg2+ transporter-C (MgtC) family protein
MDAPDFLEMVLRLGVSLVLGGALGWERELQQKPAGLRTHILVSLGAAGLAILALEMADQLDGVDPSRIIQGIIGGIGFLGAGTIIQSRGDVRGMTTAAGIWATAAIGIACGLGEFGLAVTLSVLAFIVLSAALAVEKRMVRGLSKEGGAGGDEASDGE